MHCQLQGITNTALSLEGSMLFILDGLLMTEDTVRRNSLSSSKSTFFDGSEWGVGEGRGWPSALQQNVTTAKGNS